MRRILSQINLVLRVLMEMGIVLGLGYWGYHIGTSSPVKVALAVVVPLLVFGFWGIVDFRQAGRIAEGLRLIQELLISVFAAVAVYFAGWPSLGWALAAISILHHCMVYALGERLLKRPQVEG